MPTPRLPRRGCSTCRVAGRAASAALSTDRLAARAVSAALRTRRLDARAASAGPSPAAIEGEEAVMLHPAFELYKSAPRRTKPAKGMGCDADFEVAAAVGSWSRCE